MRENYLEEGDFWAKIARDEARLAAEQVEGVEEEGASEEGGQTPKLYSAPSQCLRLTLQHLTAIEWLAHDEEG